MSSSDENKLLSARAVISRIIIPDWNIKSIGRCALVIFACWLPWAVALYPGSMNWDTFYQITQWYADAPRWFIPWLDTGTIIPNAFSDHHPIFDTFIYGLFAKTSDWLFGTWNYGVFFYLLLQALGIAFGLSASLGFLKRLEVPKKFLGALFLFMALYAPFAIYAFTMVKDSLFACIFIPWVLCVAGFMLKVDILPSRRRSLILFAVLTILLCLTKKTGLIFAFGALVVLIVQKKDMRKYFASLLLACLIVMRVFIPLVIYPVFDVVPGGKQELLGPLFQQTARYVSDYPEDVSNSEAAAIDAVLGFDRLAQDYNPQNMDKVKFGWNWQCTGQDLMNYLKVWAAQGIRHADSYVAAIWDVNKGYVTWDGLIQPDVYLADEGAVGWDLLAYPPQLFEYRTAMLWIYIWWQNFPLTGWFFHMTIFATLLPAGFCCVAATKRRELLPIAAVLWLCWVALMIGPVYQTRYGIHMVYAAPLLVGLLTTKGCVGR